VRIPEHLLFQLHSSNNAQIEGIFGLPGWERGRGEKGEGKKSEWKKKSNDVDIVMPIARTLWKL